MVNRINSLRAHAIATIAILAAAALTATSCSKRAEPETDTPVAECDDSTPTDDCADLRDQYHRTLAIQRVSRERCYTYIPWLCGSDDPDVSSFCESNVRRCMDMAENFPHDRARFTSSGCPMDVDEAEIARYIQLHEERLAAAK